ncbi:MAG: globin [Candidatus Phosphoribacter sp.]|nr:globin [Actinomycetales bacterium]
MNEPTTQATAYEQMGGHDTFVRLVRGFYARVALDPALRALYPEEDLGPAEIRLRMFLEQYWGGPNTYSQQRGHPRLRMRHAPYAVTPQQRDRWLRHMLASVADVGLDGEQEATLVDYLARAADMLVNAPEEAAGTDGSPQTDQTD